MPTRVTPDRFLHIFDSLDYQIAIYDSDWRYTYVNAEAARMLGKPVEQLIGHSIWELFPDAKGNQYYRELHEAVATGQAIHSPHFYAPFDRWFENHIYPLPDGVLVLSRDITSERRAADEIRARDQMLRLAQSAGGVATFQWDFTNLVAECSPEFFRIFGLPGREGVMPAHEWGTFVHPEDRERMAAHLERALAGLEPATADYRIIGADGRERWLTYAGEIIKTPHGDRMLGTVLDITDRKRLEAELREAKSAAEAANRLKDQFLATLSHELRTPLNAVLGYARLLRTNAIAAENRDHALEVIERNAKAQQQLIEDLLDMSRITTGKLRLDPVPVPVLPVLLDALEGIKPAADAKRMAVEVHADPEPGTVRGDAARLQQVFWNLLNNAVKYTDPGGRLTVRLQSEGEFVEAIVADNGTGIAPEFLPHVFEPFRQADAGFSRSHGGLGLGLAISRELIELHGGTIIARSDGPGQGATFVVRLPRAAAGHTTPTGTRVMD